MRTLFFFIVLIAALIDSPGIATAAPSYTVTDLGTLGGPMNKGMGTNNKGQVVGVSQSGTYGFAFLWNDGVMSNLGDLGGRGSWAHDVNNTGQVVGGSPISSGENHAFLWQNGAMQDLGTLGGPISFAFDINNSGQAVGYAWNDEGIQHAVLWGTGGIVDLGDLDPVWPNHSAAYGINDAGQVVGCSNTEVPGEYHNFLWQNGSMQDLGTLGGRYSCGMAINSSGKVVGDSWLSDNTTQRAFLWDGAMQDLGALTFTHSIAYDINDVGQVVGAMHSGQNYHAFLWTNGQMQDLNNLIPSDSGWVLQEARAINNNGDIVGFGIHNGQSGAFLLSPVYHWINPIGGSWHTNTNWDPQGDPADGATVIFGLGGQYAVDASPIVPGPNFPLGRMIVSGSNTVDFQNLSLNLLDDSVTEPALTINESGTVKITSGAGTYIHAVVGSTAPQNTSNPPTAHLQVFNSGTALNGSGRLTIGHEGLGDLFVANGGKLTSAEARLGGVYSGSAVVGGDGSYWETGSIAVGYGVDGTLTVENGARVDSDVAVVGFSGLSTDSKVIVDGVGSPSNQASLWAILGDLTVGQSAFSDVHVLNGADLYVNKNVHVANGELNIEGAHANGDRSDLDVLGNVFVGGAGSANLLAFRNGAKGDIEGDLIIGNQGKGALILWNKPSIPESSRLDVVTPPAGLCVIGSEYDGGVSLDEGGLLRCRNMQLGQAGKTGAGTISIDDGFVRVLEVLQVGQAGGGSGQVDMLGNALLATDGTYIAPNGVVNGTGTLSVGTLGLTNDGTLSPGITVLGPRLPPASRQWRLTAGKVLDVLTIEGNLTMGSTGRLKIPLVGAGAGEYGKIAVTGSATIDGVLSLNFKNGFAPKKGEKFEFLSAAGGVSGAFVRVEINGLAPGFKYKLTLVNGGIQLEALNNGVAIKAVNCATKPSKPKLRAPKHRKKLERSRVLLDWSDVECADSYKVVVQVGGTKGTRAESRKKLSVSRYRTKALQSKGKIFYWRVSACNSIGCSNSVWRYFTF